ncbi:hypothetical protein [Accumulibacter sp.]|uniref:hypothetical protein n=1 Tax=Accumulibacter sp. TaxID=2053492 RepID=UPI001AC4AA48|nr:hypothetical protein [Accumulibacter sp.]MBN8454607.1 hypothetical protein [Accumulibacter sp.]MBO3707137.1 hypothetical protein [Candidatus Accumulibacter conexus]
MTVPAERVPVGVPAPDTVLLAAVAVGAWIATHRYLGIWHDGVLYAAQAIFRLDPFPFAEDLFFAYGSQDSFTVFTSVYAWAIQWLGLPMAAELLVAMAHAVWLAAAALILRSALGGLAFWCALLLVTTLPAHYGAYGVFAYAETFLTARLWAEALSLVAVSCILAARRLAAMVAAGCAAAVHPVIALAALLFVFLFGFTGRQKVVLGVAALVTVVLLNHTGVRPFSHLGDMMDPLWLDLSAKRSPFVFLDHWRVEAYNEALFQALLLACAALVCGAESRRLWWSALGVFACGMGLALFAVFWPGVLIIQMQPWRILWLTRILAVGAGLSLLRELWPASSPYCRLILGGLAACVFSLDSTGLVCAVPLAAMLFAWRWFRIEPQLPAWLLWLAWSAIIAVIADDLFWRLRLSAILLDFNEPNFARMPAGERLFMFSKESGWIVFPILVAGAWSLLRRRPSSSRWLLPPSIVLLLYVGFHWQRATTGQAVMDRLQETGLPELSRIIQPHHLTYWGGGHAHLWFILHRGSYASTQQAAGAIFSRQTAIEAERRLSRLEKLGLPDSRFDWLPRISEQPPETTASLDGLVHVCHDPILDFVVLGEAVTGAVPLATFRLHGPESQHHLYACAALRALPDPFPSS